MVQGVNHTINKVIVNAHELQPAKALQWRSQLSHFLKDVFPGKLQIVLDDYCPPELFIKIDRLEIDVVLDNNDTQEQLQATILELIKHQLQKAIIENSPTGFTNNDGNVNIPVQQLSVQQRSISAWLYYLENGYYPWWHIQPISPGSLKDLIDECDREFIKGAITPVLNSTQAKKRLVLTVGDDVFDAIIRICLGKLRSDIIQYKLNNMQPSVPIPDGVFGRLVIKKIMLNAISNDKGIDDAVWLREYELVFGKIKDWRNLPFQTKLEKLFDFNISEQLDATNNIHRKSNNAYQNTNTDVEETIWVMNAGVVLLHPFLPQLFESLGVLDDKKNIQNINKALALLHYLLYADGIYNEADMFLPKISCGIDPFICVTELAELSPTEKEECQNLLIAVIKHWTALKNTGVESLRHTFVLRKGKLSLKPNGWLLQVEEKTEDILLDKLPWGIGIIKLPWMDELLTVEWH